MSGAVIFVMAATLAAASANAQTTRYVVKLRPDFDRREFRGEEDIEFHGDAHTVLWKKQPGLKITKFAGGELTADVETVRVRLGKGGKHRLHFEYSVTEGRGLRWLDEGAGFVSVFYCDGWMICDDSPAQRATLRLEIALPSSSPLRVVGPGQLERSWRDKEGHHFLFEQAQPVQTYLFSFGAAKLRVSSEGEFSIYAAASGHQVALRKTSEAAAFFRSKAGTELMTRHYAQVFLPGRGLGQEAAGLALLSEDYLSALEHKDDVYLMAHELAHQWWGVLVGIRSWSDFWLNEGMAEFMADAFIERYQGRQAYDRQMAVLRERMARLREDRKDRPLHWDGWTDAHEALGEIPYVKGALFLDRLRKELGEEGFWHGIALYTSRNARTLVDARDFQRAMEEASGRDLEGLFDEAVYE